VDFIASFVLAFGMCFLAMPSIIRIAIGRDILDAPSERKSHLTTTPSFGGVGIFVSCILISLVCMPAQEMIQMRYIFGAMTIIFLVGARDDLDPLTPLAKLLGQLVAIGLLIGWADIRITSLYGLFGVGLLTYWGSIAITTVVFIFLINSFNLIDGIDALCASISILILSVLGTWFMTQGAIALGILAMSAAGATLAFLKYNISPSKIFMGDTGSLVLGMICSVLVISFMEHGATQTSIFSNVTSIALGLFILPTFDTIRVFLYRIYLGKSPFDPDKNHIHHLLLDAGLTHMQSTGLLLSVNLGFLTLALRLQDLDPTIFLFLAFALAYLLTQTAHLGIYLRDKDVLRTEP